MEKEKTPCCLQDADNLEISMGLVIKVKRLLGNGEMGNPYKEINQYYTLDGKLIGELPVT